MIFIVNSDNRCCFAADLADMHRHRKAVFVDGNGWRVPVSAGMEMDCYDRADTIYLLAKEAPGGPLLASVRLIPTAGPHLMCQLFPDASQDIPRGPSIWEVSRFCTTPTLRGRCARRDLLWPIICGVMETALLFGMDQLTFAANSALLPLTLDCGWEARRLGPTMRDGNDEVTAVAVTVTPAGLRQVRQRYGVPAQITRYPVCLKRRERHD